MDRIRQQHFALVFATLVFGGTAFFFFKENIPEFEQTASFLDRAFSVGWPAFPAIIIAAYEAFGWKLLNRELDYSGYWDGVEEQWAYDERQEPKLDYNAWCEMRVRQNVRRIRLVEGHTHKGTPADGELPQTLWCSSACELDAETGRILATLAADASPKRPGGAVEIAVEVINVMERGFLGLPLKLHSHIKMTAGTRTPRFVLVSYTRRDLEFVVFLRGLFASVHSKRSERRDSR